MVKEPLRLGERESVHDQPLVEGSIAAPESDFQTAPGLQDISRDGLPPAYSGPSASTSALSSSPHSRSTASVPGLPALRLSAYGSSGAKISKDLASVRFDDSSLSSSFQDFTNFLYEQISLPPRPEIRIVGTHQGRNIRETDFDIRLNMMRYFLPRDRQSGMSYVQVVDPGSGSSSTPTSTTINQGIQEHAQKFFSDLTRPKCFTIKRTISNWDSDFITGRLHRLLESLNYKGQLRLSFPVAYTSATLHVTADPTPAKAMSFISSIRSTLAASLAWPKEYAVEVVWPYANAAPHAGDDYARKCVVSSEGIWWNDWQAAIADAILAKRQGWVGIEDWMECAMNTSTRLNLGGGKKPYAWGADTY